MSFHSNGKLNIKLDESITIEKIQQNGKCALFYGSKHNLRLLTFLARYKYKVKTKRYRIVKKYINKLMNESLREAIKDKRNESNS